MSYVYVHFGPSLDDGVSCALEYAVFKLKQNIKTLKYSEYIEDEKTIQFTLPSGTHVLDNIVIKIENSEKVYALDSRIVSEVKGYFEAVNFDIITKFFESADEYVKNRYIANIQKGTIKSLSYEYGRWDPESTMNKRSFETIHLPEKVISKFLDDVDKFMSLEKIEWYKKMEISHSRIYLLYGPPGTGKTSLIQAAASKLDMSIASFAVDDKTVDRDLKLCIKRLPTKTILCIEDIDSFFLDRKSATGSMTFSGVINAIDGINRLKDTIIFITTNHIKNIDYALKRRVDYYVEFDFCTKSQVQDIFKRFRPTVEFSEIWKVCSKLKLTPNILQKFLIRELPIEELSEFAQGDYGPENLPEMYT